jgi:foldase protein PrsA
MKTTIKLACVAAAAGLGATAAVGCGNDVPPNSVAKVGGTVITKAEFQKWLHTAATGQSQGGQAAVPDPPDYTSCVASLQKQSLPTPGKKPSDSDLKKQCKQQYEQLKGQVMQFLIQAQWVEQEAKARNVTVSQADVQKAFDDQKKQAFPNDKAYQKFLKTSGMNEQDILYRVRLDQLQTKLTQKITQDQGKVTSSDVSDYYAKNKKRFAQPERRDLNVVLTKTKAKADQAKQAIDGGQSFKDVAKKYSIDPTSKSQGGKLPDVAKGQQEKALDTPVFAAAKGKVMGPVKTQFGWYVFQVTKITPASQQSLAQASDTIRNLLKSQRQQKALDDFVKDFRQKYKDKTTCASDYRVAECENAPKQKTDTGAVSGGTPGATPQQVPQGGATPQQAPQGGATPTPTPTPQQPTP